MSNERIELTAEQGGNRLDQFLGTRLPGLSRTAARRLIEGGQVAVNGATAKASYRLHAGDVIVADIPDQESPELAPEQTRLTIVYEDDALLVVDKPAGMVVHPAPGHAGGTLVNALLAHCSELADSGDGRPGIVHRLDRDTSGLILVAKSEEIRRALQRQFQERTVRKSYLALVEGRLQPAWGRIEAPVGRDPHHRQRMAVLPGGREAVTEYQVLERLAAPGRGVAAVTLIRAEPHSGRTHQIRVHLASIGHPVVGDRIYGLRRPTLPVPRQFLHAWRLAFRHPLTAVRLELEAPLPDDLAAVLDLLEKE